MSRYYRTYHVGDCIVTCLFLPLWIICAAVEWYLETFGIVEPWDERLGRERKP